MAKDEKKDLQPQGATAMTAGVPDYLAQYESDNESGTAGLGKDLVQIPRIAIAQQLSPQLVPGDAKFIEGLKLGDMFDTLTNRILGPGPIEFAIIRRDQPRGIEFFPREQGGGVKDMNVPLTDPRMQFGRDNEGKSVKPIATRFHDYIIMTLPINPNNPFSSVIGLSMKSSQLGVSKILNGLTMARGKKPLYVGKYVLKTVFQKNTKGQFYNFAVANAGTDAEPMKGWLTAEEAAAAKTLFDNLKDRAVEIDRTEAGLDEDEIPDLTEAPSETRM